MDSDGVARKRCQECRQNGGHDRDHDRRHPLLELTRARILEFIREPEAIFWVFVFPVLLALALGIAFRSRPADEVPVAVVARLVDSALPADYAALGGRADDAGSADPGTSDAADLIAELQSAPGLKVLMSTPDEASLALRKNRVDLVVEVDPSGQVTYRFDPTRTEGRAARLSVDDVLQRALGRTDPLTARDAPVTIPGSRYIDFLIPGLVGMNLMGSGMWGIGFSVVVARTRKLLKRFAATPMRRSHYLLSFALSRLLFLALEVAAVVGFGWLIFGVKVQGSVLDLAGIALLGAAAFAALGLLVAARPRTIEAVSGWMNLVMLPMWLLSGTFFSYERFPAPVLPFIRALPLTALNDALRSVVNDGLPLAAAWSQAIVLVVWGLVSFIVAVRVFRWQ
jgi:ABC-2 type transport system permease protein